MAQKKLLREGYYICSECSNLFLIEKPNPDKDGFCDSCKDAEGDAIGLGYVGLQMPPGYQHNLK